MFFYVLQNGSPITREEFVEKFFPAVSKGSDVLCSEAKKVHPFHLCFNKPIPVAHAYVPHTIYTCPIQPVVARYCGYQPQTSNVPAQSNRSCSDTRRSLFADEPMSEIDYLVNTILNPWNSSAPDKVRFTCTHLPPDHDVNFRL